MINELISTMEDQLLCYDFLLGLSKEKTEIIVNNEIESLKKITESENEYIRKLQNLERKRMDIVRDIAYVSNLDENSLTVSSIITMIKDKAGYDELLSVSLKIRESVELLKESNDRNKVLINNSIDYIDYSINVIRTSVEKEPASFDLERGYIDNHSFFDAKQ